MTQKKFQMLKIFKKKIHNLFTELCTSASNNEERAFDRAMESDITSCFTDKETTVKDM